MAEAQLQQFLEKVRQLNAFVALSEADPALRQELCACDHHDQVVALARRCGFEIARRWGEGEPPQAGSPQGPVGGPPADASGSQPGALEPSTRSLLDGPCPAVGQEISETLVEGPGWRLERIHSCAASSPEGFWYEQQEHEWVALLQGAGGLRFADERGDRALQVGDSLWIRAGRRHRVTWTDPDPGTVWLALFWRSAAAVA